GLELDHELFHRWIQRAHGIAFAHHLQGHALPDVALRPGILYQGFGGPTQHIDKARRHCKTAGIDVYCRGRTAEITYGRDLIAANAYVDACSRSAGPVIDHPITN